MPNSVLNVAMQHTSVGNIMLKCRLTSFFFKTSSLSDFFFLNSEKKRSERQDIISIVSRNSELQDVFGEKKDINSIASR